jgi:hypothetical protein
MITVRARRVGACAPADLVPGPGRRRPRIGIDTDVSSPPGRPRKGSCHTSTRSGERAIGFSTRHRWGCRPTVDGRSSTWRPHRDRPTARYRGGLRRRPRCPSALTPVATSTTVDDPDVLADRYRQCGGGNEGDGPTSPRGRVRNAATRSSRSAAMRDTCDFDKDVTPKLCELVHPTRADTEQVAGHDHADQRRLGPLAPRRQPLRGVGAGAQLWDRDLDRAGRVSSSGCRSPFWRFIRCGLVCPYSAPHTGSAPAESSRLITVPARRRTWHCYRFQATCAIAVRIACSVRADVTEAFDRVLRTLQRLKDRTMC